MLGSFQETPGARAGFLDGAAPRGKGRKIMYKTESKY
jgi:hypothetical protein